MNGKWSWEHGLSWCHPKEQKNCKNPLTSCDFDWSGLSRSSCHNLYYCLRPLGISPQCNTGHRKCQTTIMNRAAIYNSIWEVSVCVVQWGNGTCGSSTLPKARGHFQWDMYWGDTWTFANNTCQCLLLGHVLPTKQSRLSGVKWVAHSLCSKCGPA